MAGSKEQQARYRWCVYRVRRRLEEDQPATFAAWWADAQREWEQQREERGR